MAAKKKPTAQIVTVTPQMAEEMLKKNKVNRHMSDPVAAKYSRDMNRKRWWFCPDPIVFGVDGSLYNGQHRRTWRAKWRNRPIRDTYPQTRRQRRAEWREIWPRVGKRKEATAA